MESFSAMRVERTVELARELLLLMVRQEGRNTPMDTCIVKAYKMADLFEAEARRLQRTGVL